MLGLKTSADFDDNNWNYKKYDDKEPGDFPVLDLDSNNDDDDSIQLPSPISTAKFYQILNHDDTTNARKQLDSVPELIFREKTQPKLNVESSTPVNNSPMQTANPNTNTNNDLLKLIKDQSEQILALQTQLIEEQHLINDLKKDNNKFKSHLDSKIDELIKEKRIHSQLKDEFNTLSSNYRNDREHWGKLIKNHEFEAKSINILNNNLNSKMETIKKELLESLNEKDTILTKLNTTSKERLEWLEKYENLKSQFESKLTPPELTTKSLNNQFGTKFNELGMTNVDSLDKIEAQNIIKNIIFSFNVPLTSLKDYVIFIRDDVLKFFKDIHQIIHIDGGSGKGELELNDKEKMKACMNILIDDVKSLHKIC